MQPVESNVKVLKVFPSETPPEGANNSDVLSIRVGVVQPALQPSLLIMVSMRPSSGIYCLHVQIPGLGQFEFHNMDWATADQWPDAKIVNAVLRIDAEIPENEYASLTLVTPEREFIPLAHVVRIERFVKLERISEAYCEVVDLSSAAPDPLKPIFVGGAPKSGTTWVEYILNANPSILVTGENNFWGWPEISAGFEEGVFSHSSTRRMVATVNVAPYSNVIGMMGYGRALQTLQQIQKISGLDFIGDKTPGNTEYLESMLSLFPTAVYLHCIRHPFDVIVSRAFHEAALLRANAGGVRVTGAAARSLLRTTEPGRTVKRGELLKSRQVMDTVLDEWCSINSHAFRFMTVWPERIHVVRYEELLSNPIAVLKGLLTRLGISWTADELVQMLESTHFRRLSGGREAGVEDVTSFFRKGVANDHQQHLTASQIDYASAYIRERCIPAIYAPYLER